MMLVPLVILIAILIFVAYTQNQISRILIALNTIEDNADPGLHLSFILKQIRHMLCANGVIILQRIDPQTAKVIMSDPQNVLPSATLNSTIFEGVLESQKPAYRSQFDSAVLSAMPIHSAAILPIGHSTALLCIWGKSGWMSYFMRDYMTKTAASLRLVLEFGDLKNRLQATNMRLNAILDTIPQGIVFIDQDGTYAWTNPPAAKLMGIISGDLPPILISQAMIRLRERDTGNTDHKTPQTMLFTQQLIRDWQWNFKDQNLSVSHILSENGRVWIFEDVTERKKLEAQQIEYRLEQERAKVLRDFIQNASHEFRTPLTIISMNSDSMVQSNEPENRSRKALQIQRQIQLIIKLVDMLLEMTNLASNKSLSYALLDMNKLVEATCQMSRSKHGDSPSIHYHAPTETMLVKGDKRYLQTALNEILDNAYRFTSSEGKITVTLGKQNSYLHLDVQDTGIGIAPEIMPRIFDTFFRKDQAHSTPGFGLGLSIARRIIELHHGELTVQSDLGQGSVFRIILPENDDTIKLIHEST